MNVDFLPSKPFVGLRPFEPRDSLIFFGRRKQTTELLQKLHETHFVAVIGPSGSGKSSLILAGLIPKLMAGFLVTKRDRWHIASMRPGDKPLHNLARALLFGILSGYKSLPEHDRHIEKFINDIKISGIDATLNHLAPILEDDTNLLLLVDQFEEIFRYSSYIHTREDEDESITFVSLLLALAEQRRLPVFVVMTMRSDFLGDCVIFSELPEAINRSMYLVPRLTQVQLREAIEVPTRLYNATATSPLLDRLLNDVGYNPDQLPLLQHALRRMWDSPIQTGAENKLLDIVDYEYFGGMEAAISMQADELLYSLTASDMLVAETLFKRLTEKGADNRAIRRPTRLREICAITGTTLEAVVRVIDLFRTEDSALLVPPANIALSNESIIDISHESLIRNWDRLSAWIEQEAESAQRYRRIANTAILWRAGQAALWGNPDLAVALDWLERTQPTNTWAERYHSEFDIAMEFLQRSKEMAVKELHDYHKNSKHTRKVVIVFSILLLLVLTFLIALVFCFTTRYLS